jgi:hypothetical protein
MLLKPYEIKSKSANQVLNGNMQMDTDTQRCSAIYGLIMVPKVYELLNSILKLVIFSIVTISSDYRGVWIGNVHRT